VLAQIISHTPIWVWAILAFLLYRGVLASVDREVKLKKTFLIPVVMLVLSLQGIVSTFGVGAAAVLGWLPCMLASTMTSWRMSQRDDIIARPERDAVFLRGSWTPLLLMMGIFCTKYAVGVGIALVPGLKQDAFFVTGICALYGLFNGIFIGKLLRIVELFRDAQGQQNGIGPAPSAPLSTTRY